MPPVAEGLAPVRIIMPASRIEVIRNPQAFFGLPEATLVVFIAVIRAYIVENLAVAGIKSGAFPVIFRTA